LYITSWHGIIEIYSLSTLRKHDDNFHPNLTLIIYVYFQTFDPHRFNKRQAKTITPGVYFPFSLGPRNCIGKVFAEIQIKLLLVRLFQTFRLELAPGQSDRIRERLTLRPRDGVICTMKRRQFPKAKLTRSMTCS
jgi:hypothetical protein